MRYAELTAALLSTAAADFQLSALTEAGLGPDQVSPDVLAAASAVVHAKEALALTENNWNEVEPLLWAAYNKAHPLVVGTMSDEDLLTAFPDGGEYADKYVYGYTPLERRNAFRAYLHGLQLDGSPEGYSMTDAYQIVTNSVGMQSNDFRDGRRVANIIRILPEASRYRADQGFLFMCLGGFMIAEDQAKVLVDACIAAWEQKDGQRAMVLLNTVDVRTSDGPYTFEIYADQIRAGCQKHARDEVTRNAALAGFIPVTDEQRALLLPSREFEKVAEMAEAEA